MFGAGASGLTDANFTVFMKENIWYFILGIVFSTPIAKKLGEYVSEKTGGSNPLITVLYSVCLTAGMLVSLSYLIKGAYNPFIYFNF